MKPGRLFNAVAPTALLILLLAFVMVLVLPQLLVPGGSSVSPEAAGRIRRENIQRYEQCQQIIEAEER